MSEAAGAMQSLAYWLGCHGGTWLEMGAGLGVLLLSLPEVLGQQKSACLDFRLELFVLEGISWRGRKEAAHG